MILPNGDLTALNTRIDILDTVGKDMLQRGVSRFLELMVDEITIARSYALPELFKELFAILFVSDGKDDDF
ncbi:MAG: hypothetical protein HZB37_04085 [Planctomycetes bacterium]|nr:hypothetical protein [Planctomycetota bacterium]